MERTGLGRIGEEGMATEGSGFERNGMDWLGQGRNGKEWFNKVKL